MKNISFNGYITLKSQDIKGIGKQYVLAVGDYEEYKTLDGDNVKKVPTVKKALKEIYDSLFKEVMSKHEYVDIYFHISDKKEKITKSEFEKKAKKLEYDVVDLEYRIENNFFEEIILLDDLEINTLTDLLPYLDKQIYISMEFN